MFIPGETIIHTFILPFHLTEIRQIIVTYRQDDRIVYERVVNKSNPEGATLVKQDNYTKLSYEISQADSLLFTDEVPFYMQVNVYTTSHSRAVSGVIKSTSGIQFLHKVMPKAGE